MSSEIEEKIEECEGYKKLFSAINDDKNSGRDVEERMRILHWAVDRAKHYSEVLGMSASDVLTGWEAKRDYWYMNYYQESKQPKLDASFVRVFETTEKLIESLQKKGFRCPNCSGKTLTPYKCDSGLELVLINSNGKKQKCNWSAYGLFGTLGKGVYVYVKEHARGEYIFKPLAWETEEDVKAAELAIQERDQSSERPATAKKPAKKK